LQRLKQNFLVLDLQHRQAFLAALNPQTRSEVLKKG
jgi:hypothetical protein